MAVRAIRGATQVEVDTKDAIKEAVCELVETMLTRNELAPTDLISIFFTSTPDLISDFPAVSAREMGLGFVPLICSVEIAVPGSLPRTIRAMMHCNSERRMDEVAHVYLRGASVLRQDIAQ